MGMDGEKARHGVVGLGWFSQVAILPAFAHTRENSKPVARFSGDAQKREQLGDRYGVEKIHPYEDFDRALESGSLDAVYIAVPNHLHREYTERAARAGVHVLCEKPMAVTGDDCRVMISVCQEAA